MLISICPRQKAPMCFLPSRYIVTADKGVVRLDGKPLYRGLPRQLVKSATWDDCVDEDDEDLRISFGESFRHGDEPERLAQPAALQAPETISMERFDQRGDLWRVGCAVSFSFLKKNN